MKLTAEDLYKFEVIDEIIKEPFGGVTTQNMEDVVAALKCRIIKIIEELKVKPIEELVNERYRKFRNMGKYKPLTEE